MSRCLLTSLCFALLTLGANPSLAADLPALIANLESKDANVRFDAAFEIARLGPAAKDAIPTLLKMLKEDKTGIVSDALVSIGPACIPALSASIEPEVSFTAIETGRGMRAFEIRPKVTSASAALLYQLADHSPFDDLEYTSYSSQSRVLVAMGVRVLPYLIGALGDDDPRIRCGAAIALGQIGVDAQDAGPALIQALKAEPGLKNPARECTQGFVWALGKIGPSAREATPMLQSLLASRLLEPWRPTPKQVMQNVGPAPSEVDIDVLLESLEAIAPGDRRTLNLLVEAATNGRLQLSRRAIRIGVWKSFGSDAVVALAPALLTRDPKAPEVSGFVLGSLSLKNAPHPERALGPLVQLLNHPDHAPAAIRLLGEIGPAAFPAIPRLLPMLWSADRQTRLDAAVALVRIQPLVAHKAYSELAKDLQKAEPLTIAVAGELGSSGKPLLANLFPLLEHRDASIRRQAAIAIGAIEPTSEVAISVLLAALDDTSARGGMWNNRNVEILCLARIGSREALAAIEMLVSDPRYRYDALAAMETMGPKAAPAIETLLGILRDPARVASHLPAIKILLAIGPEAKQAIPVLESFERNHDRETRHAARAAIKELSKE